jgi:hypothetical protein
MEFMTRFKPQDAVFGIANVQSRFGNCDLTVGYFLSDTAMTVLAPPSCQTCGRIQACVRAFANQILRKYNEKNGGSKVYFLA